MNTGGRRCPLGPLASGLACCALVVAVLSIWLSAGSAYAPVDSSRVVTITQSVTVAQLAVRPALPDRDAAPSGLVVLVAGMVIVLARHRHAVPHHPVRERRPSRRAPPGPLTHP